MHTHTRTHTKRHSCVWEKRTHKFVIIAKMWLRQMAIRGSKKNRNAIKVHIFPHTQLAAFVLEKWVFSSRSWLFHGSRSVPSANASCKRRMANGKAENGQSNKCSANFHVQGDKTKRNKTKRTLEPKAHRLASFPFGFRVYVCVCVLLYCCCFSRFLACCSFNLAISCYICHHFFTVHLWVEKWAGEKPGKDHHKVTFFPHRV